MEVSLKRAVDSGVPGPAPDPLPRGAATLTPEQARRLQRRFTRIPHAFRNVPVLRPGHMTQQQATRGVDDQGNFRLTDVHGKVVNQVLA